MKYTVYATLMENLNEGCCWITRPQLPSRSIVRINNTFSGETVYCEALHIEKNFVRVYKEGHTHEINLSSGKDVIVINEWYRLRLGNLQTQSEYELTIEARNSQWAKFCACIHHPQIVVRLATWLGVIGLILGLLGLVLGVVPLIKGTI